jgi:hypothetical protein
MTMDDCTRCRALSSGLATANDVPSDDESLHAWVVDHLGKRIPCRGCCLEHRAPLGALADAYVGRSIDRGVAPGAGTSAVDAGLRSTWNVPRILL